MLAIFSTSLAVARESMGPVVLRGNNIGDEGVSLKDVVAPCAKECCSNKRDFCVRGVDHDGTLCAKQHDPEACCDAKQENCLVHAANGDNCALSPLCIGKNQTKRSFEEKKAASAAAGKAARQSGQPSDVDVVSLREMVTPCAKQCCTNKKDMCIRGVDHDGTLCAKEADPSECCDGKHENCLLHAANGRNCAFSPLCSEQQMDEAKQSFDNKADGKPAAVPKPAAKAASKPSGDSSAKEVAAAKAEAAAAAKAKDSSSAKDDSSTPSKAAPATSGKNGMTTHDDEKTEKENHAQQQQAQQAQQAQATQELASSGASRQNLRDVVEPCAKQCCTNKKDMCIHGVDRDGTLCAKEADPSECCEGRLDSCIFHAANGRNCALSPLCRGKDYKPNGSQDSQQQNSQDSK